MYTGGGGDGDGTSEFLLRSLVPALARRPRRPRDKRKPAGRTITHIADPLGLEVVTLTANIISHYRKIPSSLNVRRGVAACAVNSSVFYALRLVSRKEEGRKSTAEMEDGGGATRARNSEVRPYGEIRCKRHSTFPMRAARRIGHGGITFSS